MFNNYKDQSGYYSRHPTFQDDINQPPLVPKEASKQTSAPPWDLSQPHPTYNYCTDQHLPVRMPALMQRQVVSYDNTPPLYRSYNNSNNQHVLRPKALITCQSNCNRVGCCKDVSQVPQHWNISADKTNGNVPRSAINKGVGLDLNKTISQHASVETGSRVTGNIDCGVKEFPRFHRDIAGPDHSGISVPQFKNDLTSQQETSISKQLLVTSSENASIPKKDTSFLCQRSCAPNCQQYDHQAASKFSLSGQTQLNMATPPVSNQWLCDSQTRMWTLQTKQSPCLMPLEGVDMTVNNPVASNYWLERTLEKPTGSIPTSKSSYQDMLEYQIQQEQHQKYAQHYQDSDRLKIMERVRYQESLRSSQQESSDWAQDMPRRRNLPPYPVPRYANANAGPRPNPLATNPSLPPSYSYAHSKVPVQQNYTDPTQYPSKFNSTYTQAQSKISKSNTSFNPHVHSTHATNIASANCIRPTIIQHQPTHFATNVEVNSAQTKYISSGQPYNNQPYNSCNEAYNNVNYSKTMQVVDKPCLNTPRIIQPYNMYDKNIDPVYKNIFGQNAGPVTHNLIYDKNNMPPRQVIYDQSYRPNAENLQSSATHQQLGNNVAAFHSTRPIQENIGMLGSHAVPQNALFGQPPTAISQVELDAFTLVDSSDRPIKKRKSQLIGFEKPLGMDLRQFIETWEEEPEDAPYHALPDTDNDKVGFRGVGEGTDTLEDVGLNVDSSVIKVYPTDSDDIQAEMHNTGTSVIKPLNIGQQLPEEQHTLSSEKLDTQEPNLHIKSNDENIEAPHSPSGILQNLLSSSEDITSPVGDFLSDELNGSPKNVQGIKKMPPGSQLSCDYVRSIPSTDDGNLEKTLQSTKCSKPVLDRHNVDNLLPIVKQHEQLKESNTCRPTPLTKILNSEDTQIDSINLKSVSGENLPEEIKPNSQSYSDTANANNKNMINEADFDHRPTLPEEVSSEYRPRSPIIIVENAPLVADKDVIKNSTEIPCETDTLSICVLVHARQNSSLDVNNPIHMAVPTTLQPNNTSDSFQRFQEINIPCKSSSNIMSRSTNSQKVAIVKNNNLSEAININHVQPEVAIITQKSSRKRKSLQERSIERETTLKSDNSHTDCKIPSPIKATENTSIVLQKMHIEGIGSHLKEISTPTCDTEETVSSKSVLSVDVDCFPTTEHNNSVVHQVSGMPTGLNTHISNDVLIPPVSLNKPAAVSSTSDIDLEGVGLHPQHTKTQNNSLKITNIKHLIPTERFEQKNQGIGLLVITPDLLIMENEAGSLIDTKMPGKNLVHADQCNAIQNTTSTSTSSPVPNNTKSNQSNIGGSCQSSSHNFNLNSSDLNIKETLYMGLLTENGSQHLQNVVEQKNELRPNVVSHSPMPLDEETQPVSVTEGVKETTILQEHPIENTIGLPSTLPVSQKKDIKLSQSCQEKGNSGMPKNSSTSQDKLNQPLNSHSVSNSPNIPDTGKNDHVTHVAEKQSTGHLVNEKSNVVEGEKSQSLEKCSNSVIRYISSEILDRNDISKHSLSEQGLPVETSMDLHRSLPVLMQQEDTVSTVSNNSDSILEHTVVRDCPKKSKLLSVRIVKKRRNPQSMCDSTVKSVPERDEHSKEYLHAHVEKQSSTAEFGTLHGTCPKNVSNENIGLELLGSFNDSNDNHPVEFSNSCDVDINKSKTQACKPCPLEQIDMTVGSPTSNTHVEPEVLSPAKLPETQDMDSDNPVELTNSCFVDINQSITQTCKPCPLEQIGMTAESSTVLNTNVEPAVVSPAKLPENQYRYKDNPVEFPNSCVTNINKSKTQTCKPCPLKHIVMTVESPTSDTNVELAVVSPVKLPENHDGDEDSSVEFPNSCDIDMNKSKTQTICTPSPLKQIGMTVESPTSDTNVEPVVVSLVKLSENHDGDKDNSIEFPNSCVNVIDINELKTQTCQSPLKQIGMTVESPTSDTNVEPVVVSLVKLPENHDRDKDNSVEFPNSCVIDINKLKTETCQPCPLNQNGMTVEPQTLNSNAEPVGLVTSAKLPENQRLQSQNYSSSDESNEDILDLDASYDFDMQTEKEPHSIDKECFLNSVTNHVRLFNAFSNRVSLNLDTTNKENSDNGSDGAGYKLQPHGNHAKPYSNATVLGSPVRPSTSRDIFDLITSSASPVFHDGEFTAHIDVPSSFLRADETNDSLPHINKATRSKDEEVDDFSTQPLSNSCDLIQSSVKNTSSNQDGHVANYELNKSNCTDRHTNIETLNVESNNLLKSGTGSKIGVNIFEPQPTLLKHRCDRVNELNFTTKSENEVDSHPVLNNLSLITDIVSTTVENSVCGQECITLQYQHLENENRESLDQFNESQTQTKRCVPSRDLNSYCAKKKLYIPVDRDQSCEIETTGTSRPTDNLKLCLQEGENRDDSIGDGLREQSDNKDKCHASDIDAVAVVNRDAQSPTDDNSGTVDKARVGTHLVKNNCLEEDSEKEVHGQTSEDYNVPVNEQKHSMEDNLAAGLPVNRVQVKSLHDSDKIINCNEGDRGTLDKSEFPVECIPENMCSADDNLEKITQSVGFLYAKNSNSLKPTVNKVQSSIEGYGPMDLNVDPKVSIVEEQQLVYNPSFDTNLQDNKYNCEYGIDSVKSLPLDKDECSMEDNLSEAPLLSKDGEHSINNSSLDVANNNAAHCVMGIGFSVNMDIPEGEHSQICHAEHEDECLGEADIDKPLLRDKERLDGNVGGNEVRPNYKGGGSSMDTNDCSMKGKSSESVGLSKGREIPDVNTTDNSLDEGFNVVGHLMEDEFVRPTSVQREEANFVNCNSANDVIRDSKGSSKSGDFPLIHIDKDENSAADNDASMIVGRQADNSMESCVNEIMKYEEYDTHNGKYMGVKIDNKECLEKGNTFGCVDNEKEKCPMENGFDMTLVVNDVQCSLNDGSVKMVEEVKDMADNPPLEVHLIHSTDKSSASGDLVIPDPMSDSAAPLLPTCQKHSTNGEECEVATEMIKSTVESKIVCLPHQQIDTFDTCISSFSPQSQSFEGYSFSSKLSLIQASNKSVEIFSTHNNSKSNLETVHKHTDDDMLDMYTPYDDSHPLETEPCTTCHEDHVTSTESVSQACLESFQVPVEVKSTTDTNVLPECPKDILYNDTDCQNHLMDSNSDTFRMSEEEAIEMSLPTETLCTTDTLSNTSESPEMPLLEIISDLNSNTDQEAPYESCCDSDTEMPLLEKYSNSPTSNTKDDQIFTTNSKPLEESYDLISKSSGNWNSVAKSEEQCTDVSCVDLIPVDSVSNWPYLEEEVFSEAQITGSPQVEFPTSCLDDALSDQRLMLSSSDTETEPEPLGVPSTNTALDIVRYKNGKSDMGKETMKVMASSADLKCRLSWKKIFNLAKVQERKKQHRVGEAKNRKEAYRRWPYYGKTGHKRRTLKSPSMISNSIDKCDDESSAEMSSNDVDGLVLGPAKIEFRLAPKLQSERWQVVDGSKPIKLCDEENNNLGDRSISTTLKTQAPIVLVKRIILKRRGDGTRNTTNIHNLSRNYPCSTSTFNPPNTCSNRPIAHATLAIPSSHPLHDANCESEFSCLTTPPESDDSSTSLKTLERLPKVIIKRTGYGNAKYKSFLRLSAAGGSRWQPFVRLERKRYLDNLAKQLFPKSDFADVDIGNSTLLPIAVSVTKQLHEVNEGPPACKVLHTDTLACLTLSERVLARPVDLNQENVPKKLCTGIYTTIKKHSKDTKLTFQLSNTNKQCTEECDADEKAKQGIVNNKIIKTSELDECQVRVLKTNKHSARRRSEGGTSQVKKKLLSKYRERIGSEGANGGVLKPKKRALDESNHGVLWHTDVKKAKFPKINLMVKDNVPVTDKEYNGPPEKTTTKEQKGRKSLKQKLKVMPCQACDCSAMDEAEQSAHIIQHPFHCQKCTVAFKSEDDFKSHLSTKHPLTKELHHCLLCKLSFPSAKQHQQHLSDRQHRHLDLTQRWTIQTLFKMFTGDGCSRITLTDCEVAEMSQLTDAEAGAINYYHQATPLQLAVQDLLKQSEKFPLAGTPVSLTRMDQDTNDAGPLVL